MKTISGPPRVVSRIPWLRTPRVVPASWGYRLCGAGVFTGWPVVLCGLARGAGLICWLLAVVLWGGRDVFADRLLMTMLVGLTGALFAAGWLLYWYGYDRRRELRRHEAQVDLERQELRIGRKAGWSRFEQDMRIPFSRIGSLLVLQARDAGSQAGLYARLGCEKHAFELLTGSEAVLAPIRSQLMKDITRGS